MSLVWMSMKAHVFFARCSHVALNRDMFHIRLLKLSLHRKLKNKFYLLLCSVLLFLTTLTPHVNTSEIPCTTASPAVALNIYYHLLNNVNKNREAITS